MLVKLNERGVRAYMAPAGARPRADWQSRTGRVVKYSRDRSHAYVIWNGRHSWERTSVDLIEPCSFAPDVADALVGDGGVDDRVGDRAMAHEGLKGSCIDSTGRQGVSGSMTEHVGVDREWQSGGLAKPFYEPLSAIFG